MASNSTLRGHFDEIAALGRDGYFDESAVPISTLWPPCQRAPVTHQATHLAGTFAQRSSSLEFSRTRRVQEQLR